MKQKPKPSQENLIIGTIIKMLREAKPREPRNPNERHLQVRASHLTQYEVAEKLHIEESTMSKIERGLLKIQLDLIEKLTRILHLTPVQRYLLLAVSGLFALALTEFLDSSSQLKDLQNSFHELDLLEKNQELVQLEAMTQRKLQQACQVIYPRLSAEIGAGDARGCVNSLRELNSLLNSGNRSQLEHILGTVTVLITKAIPESSCSIYLFDISHKPHKLIMQATSDSNLTHHPPPSMTLNEGNPVGRAAMEGRKQFVPDPIGGCQVIMPVLAFCPRRHQLLGVISTSSLTHAFADFEIDFLETICGLLAAHYRTDNNPKHQDS